jgi:hypothetical protein
MSSLIYFSWQAKRIGKKVESSSVELRRDVVGSCEGKNNAVAASSLPSLAQSTEVLTLLSPFLPLSHKLLRSELNHPHNVVPRATPPNPGHPPKSISLSRFLPHLPRPPRSQRIRQTYVHSTRTHLCPHPATHQNIGVESLTDAHQDISDRDAKIEHHKNDSVQKGGKGEWKPELASNSEQTVKADRHEMSMEEMQKEGAKKAEEGKQSSGSSSTSGH